MPKKILLSMLVAWSAALGCDSLTGPKRFPKIPPPDTALKPKFDSLKIDTVGPSPEKPR